MAKKKRNIGLKIYNWIVGIIAFIWSFSIYGFFSDRVGNDKAFYILTGLMILLTILWFIFRRNRKNNPALKRIKNLFS